MDEKEDNQDIKNNQEVDTNNIAGQEDYDSSSCIIDLEASDDELNVLEQVFSKEEYAKSTSFETKCNLYNECISELRALRGQYDDCPNMLVRDYLVASHANLDDDSLLEIYIKLELSLWEGEEKLTALKQFLQLAQEYDWNPKQKSELYLSVCELALQNLYIEIAKTAIDKLKVIEKAPPEEFSLDVFQGARMTFCDALITAARSEGNEDVQQLATVRFCDAVRFCIKFLPQHPNDLGQFLLDFLQTEKQFVDTADKQRCLVSGYSILHHILRPRVDRIISKKSRLQKEDKRAFLRYYVDCQAKFAIMLQSKNDHENAYEVFDDACKIQQILVNCEKDNDPSCGGDARTLEVLRSGQALSFGIIQGLMNNELKDL